MVEEATRKCLAFASRGDDGIMDAAGDGRISLDGLPLPIDHAHGHLKSRRYAGEFVAQEEVLVVGQISQGLFHPLLGALLDNAHIA